jgi:hypothetical protein
VSTLPAVAGVLAIGALPVAVHPLVGLMGRARRRRGWASIDLTGVDEPIVAVKRARIRLASDGSSATLSGYTGGGSYAVEAVATCPRGCDVPEPGCGCGFHAVRPTAEARTLGGPDRRPTWDPSVRLEVELTGTVLEYELGYRAEEQRVLRVGVPSGCLPCARHGRSQRAAALAPVPSVLQPPLGIGPARPGGARTWSVMEPVCDRHRSARPHLDLALVRLAGQLGTEVGWDPVEARSR